MTRSRHTGEPRHVRLYEWMTNCAAWQDLDVYGRQLYVEFKRRYTGTNNGDIAFSGEEMAAALNCSNKPADRALRALADRGFIKLSRRGSFDWKTSRATGNRSNTYTLTEYPIDFPQKVLDSPSKDFMRWRPENKTRGDESTPLGGRKHPTKEGMGGRKHPNGGTRAPDKPEIDHADGGTTAPTYSLPLPSRAGDIPAPTAEDSIAEAMRRSAALFGGGP